MFGHGRLNKHQMVQQHAVSESGFSVKPEGPALNMQAFFIGGRAQKHTRQRRIINISIVPISGL